MLAGIGHAVLFSALAGQFGGLGSGVMPGLGELGHKGYDAVVAVSEDCSAGRGWELGRLDLAEVVGGEMVAMHLGGFSGT